MRPLSKLTLVLGLIAVPVAEVWANTITLSCSGSFKQSGEKPVDADIPSITVRIDLADKTFTIEGIILGLPIIKESEASFFARSVFKTKETAWANVDRLTGRVTYYVSHPNDTNKIGTVVILECRPAKPLF